MSLSVVPEEQIAALAGVFKALGDEVRIRIIAYLMVRTLCVCELVPLLGISQSAVSQHLRRLKEAGWVHGERRGQWVYYSLNATMRETFACIFAKVPDMSLDIRRLDQGDMPLECKL